jgi:hypothetical protein
VIAIAALALAAGRRRTGRPELAGLAYALLAIGGLKLLLDDVPAGRPSTLFVSLACYGLALVSTASLLRTPRRMLP